MSLEHLILRDPQSSATAKIAPGFGFNCYDFTVQRRGRSIPVLWSAPDFEAGTAGATGSGIPIMFPFPGRIQGTILQWEGREYQLAEGDSRGNAIHGFVLNRPWRILDQTANRVLGEFHAARDDVSLRQAWPADFRIRVLYELLGENLVSEITVDNPDSRPLPCGLGTHPYFRVPLGSDQGGDCIIQLPVSEQWELRDMITTGVRSAAPQAQELQTGRPFRELFFDNVFTGLVPRNGWASSSIHDPASGVRVEQSFDSSFRECVVYTPGHREAICIEPLTCVPGCFDLTARGIEAGLRILAPGASFQSRITIRVT